MSRASRGARYVRFLGWSALLLLIVFAVGLEPTRRLAGAEGLPAMWIGGAIGFVGAALAGLVLVNSVPTAPADRLQVVFLAMSVRLIAAVVLGAAAVLSGRLARTPLLFWLATSYVAMLPLEVRLAIQSQ